MAVDLSSATGMEFASLTFECCCRDLRSYVLGTKDLVSRQVEFLALVNWPQAPEVFPAVAPALLHTLS